MKANTMRRFGLLAALAIAAGCGGTGLPTLYPASGRIRVGGRPAAGVLVRFHPRDERPDPAIPHAATGADGRFALETSGRPGAPPGRYAVTLTWPPPPGFGPPGRAASDRLAGRYASKDQAFDEVTIQPADNDIGTLDVPKTGRSPAIGPARPGNRP